MLSKTALDVPEPTASKSQIEATVEDEEVVDDFEEEREILIYLIIL